MRTDPSREAQRVIRAGSRSFWLASFLLAPTTRSRALTLYRFCREADDAVDRAASGAASAVADLSDRLAAIAVGRPEHLSPADAAFAAVLAECRIPVAVPEALIEGFAWDASLRRYEGIDDLLDYARRVAGTVGLMMCASMGIEDRAMLSAGCDLGCAMQLTNIARDIGEDAREGRLYLPLSWLREQGIDPDSFVAEPAFDARIARVTDRLLSHADALYRRAAPAIARLARRDRAAIAAAALLYREIGVRLRADGLDSVSARARVSTLRQATLLLRALAWPMPRTTLSQTESNAAFLDATFAPGGRATPRRPMPAPPRVRSPIRQVDDRIGWLALLFERLERADLTRISTGAPPG